jgi:hypothetical protein
VLETPIGKNVEAYVDDVVVKTTAEDKLITDLTETFANLREFQWKLNPTKCVFGVPSGLFLGFMVRHRGIEANPTKIDAICKMAKPSNKKDVMKLTGMMEALGRFISKLVEKGLPLFKLLSPERVRGSQRVLYDTTSYDTSNPEGNTPTLHLCHH